MYAPSTLHIVKKVHTRHKYSLLSAEIQKHDTLEKETPKYICIFDARIAYMSTQKIQAATAPAAALNDEQILVVKRTTLFPDQAWHGLKAVDQDFIDKVLTHQEFQPRSLMEEDPSYQQIIPYLVFEHQGNYFLMQRQAKASETRLQSKYSFGIGGHIREEDITGHNIAHWATREFHEEVAYDGSFTVEPLGILNDDSNDVGKVHVGFVYILKGNSSDIQVKEELKNGQLLPLEECEKYYDAMESWSQIVFDKLKERA